MSVDEEVMKNAVELLTKKANSMLAKMKGFVIKDYEAYLNKFPYLNGCFSPFVSSPNVFAPLNQATKKETAYTSMVGYFLQDKDFGQYLYKGLCRLIGIKQIKEMKSVVCEKTAKDYGRLDIFIKSKDEKNIIIEAKVTAQESGNQLKNYSDCFKEYREKYQRKQNTLVLLTIYNDIQHKDFKNIMWLELAAAFYAGYNTYKFMNNKGSKWYEMKLGEKDDTYNGVYLQMWLSNILTYLYEIDEIDEIDDTELYKYNFFNYFVKTYISIMNEIAKK